MLENLRRVRDMQGLPRTRPGTPTDFFEALDAELAERPVGVGELYFEYPRGVYPSDAREIHASLGSVDKSLEFLPGEHYFEDGGRDEVADLIAAWVADRG